MDRRTFLFVFSLGVLSAPLAAEAQPTGRVYRIGYLAPGSATVSQPFVEAFREGLRELGLVEGQNIVIDYRFAEGRFDRLPDLAAELVRLRVDVIMAGPTPPAMAAKNATGTIPIVMAGAGDPVEQGLVASLARPGGNLTGVSFMFTELLPKQLELLSELVPQARAIALLWNPNNANSGRMISGVQEVARTKGVQLHLLKAGTDSEIDAAFATLVQLHVGGLVVSPDSFFGSRREQLVALASHHAGPAINAVREWAEAGGLISYGTSLTTAFRQLGVYAGRLLNGAKP